MLLMGNVLLAQTNFTEDFNALGKPTTGSYWGFTTTIHPSQNTWNAICPGDGYAYLTVDSDLNNDTDLTNPYQTISVGTVGPGHKLETRVKGIAVPGLVGFIFTYQESGSTFNEIDIEIVPDDDKLPPVGHDISAPTGWTDARFNCWGMANVNTELPYSGDAKPIVDGNNKKISLIDDQFHILTIDWYTDKIFFLIDGVLQQTVTTALAKNQSDVIIGFRDLAWAGPMTWTGTKTLVIDWLKVTPNNVLGIDLNVNYETITGISIYPNPNNGIINIDFPSNNNSFQGYKIYSIEGILLKEDNLQVSQHKVQLECNELAKGAYILMLENQTGEHYRTLFSKN
jgi:beta-glucanase (GH16 family)